MDQCVMTPWQTMMVQAVPLSPHIKAWFPFQNFAALPRMAMMQYAAGRMPGQSAVLR